MASAMFRFLSLLVLVTHVAYSAPTIRYPISQQQPPVARIGKLFTFDLLPNTFVSSSSTSTITYTISTLPQWCSFSAGTLMFSGTPTAGDAGTTSITVTATDGTGSATTNFTLLVSNYSVPAVHRSFQTQIASPSLHVFSSATTLPGYTGVSVPPYWSFSLGFQPDTFRISTLSPTNNQLFFQAHQRGIAGLPSWLKFNNETLTFDGVAPANGSYTIVATGTDFWGYTGAQTSFVIEVGTGQGVELLRTVNLTDAVTMARNQLSYTVDVSQFLVGGRPAAANQLVVSADTTNFPWLSIDSSANIISGMTPDAYLNGTTDPLNLPINVRSTNASNTLSLTTWVGIDIVPYLFSTYTIPNATANPGQQFNFNLGQYLNNKTASINATVSPQNASTWLTFYPGNMSLIGTVPSNPSYAEVDVVFSATAGSTAKQVGAVLAVATGPTTATTTLKVTLAGVVASGSPSGTAAVPNGTSSDNGSGGSGLSTGAKIAIGVVLGIVALIAILLLLFCCCRKRRKDKKKQAIEPEKDRDDADSFVAGSPRPHNSREYTNFAPPAANLLGEIPRFSGFHMRSSVDDNSQRPMQLATEPVIHAQQPTRLDGLKGIFGWSNTAEADKEKPMDISPRLDNRSGSFEGTGVVIGINDPVDRPSHDASSFTHTFGSSDDSRASWESPRSFRWSSAENEGEGGNRASAVPSIPRPRDDFTPRYPRNASPTALARLTQAPSEDGSHASFSEFHSSQEGRDLNDTTRDSIGTFESHASGSRSASASGMSSGLSLPAGPSGLGRFADSQGFRSIEERDEDESDGLSNEGPAIVAMAERQSFETRRPSTNEPRPTPRLRPSRERVGFSPIQLATPVGERSASETAFPEHHQPDYGDGAFDDADEHRRSAAYAGDAIFFGSPGGNTDNGYVSQRSSAIPSEARSSTIRAVPAHENPMSPPLPQVGSFMRHRRTGTASSSAGATGAIEGAIASGTNTGGMGSRPTSTIPDGRVVAVVNETFSIHPHLNPPPTVSLSAATWSSNPPSTYRAEREGGGTLPAWLHFDNRELELWGVPGVPNMGETIAIRIVERLGNNNRRSDPMSYGYEPPQDREVGRIVIEVLDRIRSPQFALENSPHAL